MTRAFLFPGQGSQTIGMGRALAESFAPAREVFEEVDEALNQKLSRLMWEGPDQDLLLTENAQPAIMAASLAVIVGRRKGLTGRAGHWRSWLFPLAPVLGLVISAIFLVANLLDPDAGRPGVLILIVLMTAGAAWYAFVLRRRPGGWAPRLDA